MARTRQARWAGLAAIAVLATACSGDTTPGPTVKVDRGPVTVNVSASGSLVSTNDQNIGFADRGKLAELMVAVGDRVTAGQPLARLDDGALTQALASAQAKLDQQQASLDKITGSFTVEGAQAVLDNAYAVLEATEANVDAINSANGAATERARVQRDFDRQALEIAKAQAARNPASCMPSMGGTTTTTGGASPSTPQPTATPPPAAERADDEQPEGDEDSGGGLFGMGAPVSTAQVRPVAHAVPLTDVSYCPAVQSAQRTLLLSETALDQAENTENTAATQGRISVEQARGNVVTAENQLETANRDRPADTAVQAAAVRDAQIARDGARRDVDNATLRAPVSGVVSTINGQVGEFIAAAGGATTLAPGSTARVPAAAGGAAAEGSAAAGGEAGGAFITLTDVDTFQLVVPFEESDAAQIAPNQPVEVSIDAIAGLTKPGTVVAVAPAADTVSGVVSYYVTIVLNETDPRLKDGQTAQADVRTQVVEQALRVPTSVIRQDGGRSVVDVPGPDGAPVPTPITTGLTGGEFVEVTSGLQEGQEVLLPQATVTATQGGPPQN